MPARRPCAACGHGITKHRHSLADQSMDGRQTDRNTSCRLCHCGIFRDATEELDGLVEHPHGEET